jgi:hypothetical protein
MLSNETDCFVRLLVMSIHLPHEREDLLIASSIFGLIGVVLIALVPHKGLKDRVSTA